MGKLSKTDRKLLKSKVRRELNEAKNRIYGYIDRYLTSIDRYEAEKIKKTKQKQTKAIMDWYDKEEFQK